MIKKTIVGKTIRELRSRCQSLERSQEKIKPEPVSMKEYFEHQNNMNMNMKMEKLESIEVNQDIEKELRQTREKLAQCQNSLKNKERIIEDQEKEINQLQSKRKKKNIDMKLLMYEKDQLELTLSGNRVTPH